MEVQVAPVELLKQRVRLGPEMENPPPTGGRRWIPFRPPPPLPESLFPPFMIIILFIMIIIFIMIIYPSS